MIHVRFDYVLLPFLCAFLFCGCAMQRAQDAEEAQRRMVGMDKEKVFACMGIPKRKGIEGNTEIWLYESGNRRVDRARETASVRRSSRSGEYDIFDSLGAGLELSDEVRTSRFCTVQIVMNDGRVTAVNYNGPTGGFLTDDEQCAFAVRNCL